MLSLLRLERKQNNSSKPFRFRISFFFSYSFGIETILRSYNPVVLWKTIPDSRQKGAKTTKTAQKPYPIGPPKPNYSLYKRVPPPPPGLFIPAIASHPVLDQKWGENEDVCRYRYRRQQRWLSFACWILQTGRALCSLWTADAFPVVASLPPKNRRKRSEDWKRVYCSQARLCVEFDHVLYMCDSAWNRCISTRSRKVFSFHEEHAKYELCNLQDVVTLHKESKETLHYLRRNEALIQSEIPSLPTFSMTHSPRKEGVNGVDRIATKGEKYYWLPTKREKNYRLPIGKILTDYRQGLTLSIFYFTAKGASCIFPTFLGRNLRCHRLSKFNWKDKKGEKPNNFYFDGRHKS